jgi:hypothetical protein
MLLFYDLDICWGDIARNRLSDIASLPIGQPTHGIPRSPALRGRRPRLSCQSHIRQLVGAPEASTRNPVLPNPRFSSAALLQAGAGRRVRAGRGWLGTRC